MRRDALGAGLAAVCLWGLAPVATRAAVAHLPVLPLLLIRLAAASLVLLPWAWPVFRRLRPRSAGRLLAAGVLGLVGYNLPVTAGLRLLPAATAGLLLATEPVWVLVLGHLFLGERGGVRAWVRLRRSQGVNQGQKTTITILRVLHRAICSTAIRGSGVLVSKS